MDIRNKDKESESSLQGGRRGDSRGGSPRKGKGTKRYEPTRNQLLIVSNWQPKDLDGWSFEASTFGGNHYPSYDSVSRWENLVNPTQRPYKRRAIGFAHNDDITNLQVIGGFDPLGSRLESCEVLETPLPPKTLLHCSEELIVAQRAIGPFAKKAGPSNEEVASERQMKDASAQVGEGYVSGAFSRMLKGKALSTGDTGEDPLMRVFGEFGRWQLTVAVILFLINITYVFQLVVAEYAKNLFGEYWCARPPRLAHVSIEKWIEISGVSKLQGGITVYDPCFKKNMNYEDLRPEDPSTWKDLGGYLTCTSWEYESNYSLTSEWHLSCSVPTAKTMSESLFALGGLCGSALSGFFADRKGRRTYIMYTQAINVFVCFFTALSPTYWFYLTFRGIQGFVIVGFFPILSIMSMELTGKSYMGLVGPIFKFSFPAAYVLSSILAHHVDNWRHLHFAVTLLSLFLLTVWWILPESPRWLWTQKKYTRLVELMKQATRINKTPLANHDILRHVRTAGPMSLEDGQLKVRWSDIYKTKTIRKLSLVSSAIFFCTYIAYYGILLRLNHMHPVDVFKAQLFTAVVEFSAISLSLSTSSRKWISNSIILFVSFISSGILFFLVNSLPGHSTGIPYCLIFARFFMALLNTKLLGCVAELFPTKMRGYGLGFANSFNFLAFLVTANFFRLEELKTGLPVFLMGISAFSGAFLIFLLPSSPLSTAVPDTIQQVENPFG